MSKNSQIQLIIQNVNNDYSLDINQANILRISENTTVKLKSANNQFYIMRINRPNYHTYEELECELKWMINLGNNTDIIMPSVIMNNNHSLISELDEAIEYGTNYSIFSYIEGTELYASTKEEQLKLISIIGETAAKLHMNVINNTEVSNLSRFSWDYKDLIGANSRWGDWKTHPALENSQIQHFEQVLSIIERKLSTYEKTAEHFGLIHADLHPGNFMNTKLGIALIDFDDCGYGWFLYECGCSVMQFSEYIDELVSAWIIGYEHIRTLSPNDKNMIWSFVILRRIVRIAWMNSHSDSTTAQATTNFKNYINKTVILSKKYLLQ